MGRKTKSASGSSARIKRRRRQQVAALCWRENGKKREVLLITSRDTGRWIIPKGWPIDGLDACETALQEAWEEAGVAKAKVRDRKLGTYDYVKRVEDGEDIAVRATVFPCKVKKLAADYPEVEERDREWVSPKEAARRVDEPELKSILKQL